MSSKKSLRIAILSQGPKLYSTQRLVEAARAKGHSAIVVNPLQCYMNIEKNNPTVHHKGKVLSNIDAVIPRIAASNTIYGTAVLRQFEVGGVYVANSSVSIVRSRDKLRVHQMLARGGIGMPKTSYAHATDCTRELINMVGGAPMIIKLTEGAQGAGVVKVDTAYAAESVIDAFRNLDANILVQEFIAEAEGTDIRCFVVGERVVAAMMRQSAPGEFRANIHRGGKALPIKLTPEERSIAVRVAKMVGLNVAGVDLIRSNHGPLVLEINSSPGLEGIESSSGKDVAGFIIKHIEDNVSKSASKRKEL